MLEREEIHEQDTERPEQDFEIELEDPDLAKSLSFKDINFEIPRMLKCNPTWARR